MESRWWPDEAPAAVEALRRAVKAKIRFNLHKARRAKPAVELHGLVVNRIVSINEVVGVVKICGAACEVCATAEGEFDPDLSILTVRLGSFVRTADLLKPEERFTPQWLPAEQVVREHVSREEAGDLARDIFMNWTPRVRLSMARNATVSIPASCGK